MKFVKRFGIDVETAFGGEDYDEKYYLNIEDLEMDYPSAMDGANIVEITINGKEQSEARFTLDLQNIDALFDALNHIRNKVLEQKPQPEENKE